MKLLKNIYIITSLLILNILILYVTFQALGTVYSSIFLKDTYHVTIEQVLSPYVMFKNFPEINNKLIQTNELGYRERKDFAELASYFPENRIVVVGASPVFGAYATSNEKTMPSRLEQYLSEVYDEVDCFDFLD